MRQLDVYEGEGEGEGASLCGQSIGAPATRERFKNARRGAALRSPFLFYLRRRGLVGEGVGDMYSAAAQGKREKRDRIEIIDELNSCLLLEKLVHLILINESRDWNGGSVILHPRVNENW